MLSILDIYSQAFYWQVFAPAPRWHRDVAAVDASEARMLQGAGKADLNRLPRPLSSGTDARSGAANSHVAAPAPRGRRGIDITV